MNLGAAGVWAAFAVAIASGMLYLAVGAGVTRLRAVADWTFRLQALLLLGLVAWLWHLLTTHQFQYTYVAAYTSRALETKYLFAALWGGQQGTFLLWATWGGILGTIFAFSRNRLVPTAMFFLNWTQVFLLLILVIEGPFKVSRVIPADGAGLNPLLQDYWMTIHPPVLFLGFSSLIIPYALAMSTLECGCRAAVDRKSVGARFRRYGPDASKAYVWLAMIYAVEIDTRVTWLFLHGGRLQSGV